MNKLAIGFFATLAAATVSLGSVACDRPNQTVDRQPAAEDTNASKAPVSDSWITTKIEAQYFADADVKARNIDVTTTNGAVTLDGRVDSERARQRAVEIAQKTDGVKNVDDSLEVGPAPASAGLSEQASRGWLTTKIQAKYFADPDVKGRNIDVAAANGVVTLSGTVDSETARRRAIEIARTTDGVRDVEDHLRVETAGAERADSGRATDRKFDDDEIADRIEAKFYRDENVGSNDIDVRASGGIVTLSGTVDTEAERRRAMMLARRTAGVRDVIDELKVESRVATSGKSAKRGSDLGDRIEDGWITTKIQSKFFVDDEVEGNIDVNTNKGVVTLTGEAKNAEASRQAEMIARETSGVTRVLNRLKVVPQTR